MVRITILAMAACLLSGCYYDVSEIEAEDMRRPGQMADSTGWSQSGNLQTFARGVGATMQRDFPIPGNYTVQFGLGPPPALAGAAAIRRPKADVFWTVSGNTIQRELTIQNGTSITGQADSVSVQLYDDLVTGMAGVPGGQYVGSIQVSKGSRGSNTQAPIFYPREFELVGTGIVQADGAISLPPAATARVNIPLGATQVQVTVSSSSNPPVSLTAADVSVDILSPSGIILAQYFPVPTEFIWIPSQADRIQLRHYGTPAGNLLFGAVFGIDG